MLRRTRQAWSVDEFLNWEEQQSERWELQAAGPWRMMAGGTLAHGRIIANMIRMLDRQTRGGPCETLAEQIKVRTAARVYYPDVFVRCGPADLSASVIEDPCLVVEVVSPSTEKVDEAEKMREYFTVPGLGAYVLVRQVPRAVEIYSAPHRLLAELLAPGDRCELPGLGYVLTFEEAFEGLPEDLSGG
jgi:Uma2 family endonuclease